ncbi:MAG: RDD family protein [Gammaproteobacteria bacterium]
MAAILYDTLLVFSLLFGATALAILVLGKHFNARHIGFTLYLIIIWFSFYAWFWTHGGQTLGMRAWRLRAYTFDNQALDIWHCVLRFGFSIPATLLAGIGFLWALIDPQQLTWHDRWSKTYIRKI